MEFRRKHPDVRRKLGVSEGSKRRKHSHHRHHRHHRHRNEDLVSHPPPPVLVDIEEVEILAAADVNLKKKINDEPQIRKRSMSRDNVRERSVSPSTGRVHHHERDVKSYSDTNDRGKTSDSLKKAKDHHSERERSRHSGREDRHGSRDTLDRDREKEIGRERESKRERERERERVRDRNKDKGNGRDRERDRDNYRGRDRDRDRNRESLKRYVDEQDDYEERVELKLAQQEEEEYIDRIKEESRKRRQAILEKYKQQQSQQSKRSAHMLCDDIFGESHAGVRTMVGGPAQPTYSSSFQFGTFEPMPPNPNPKQPQPSVQPESHSRPSNTSLPHEPKKTPSDSRLPHRVLILQWGRGVRSTNTETNTETNNETNNETIETIKGIDPRFFVHALAGNNIHRPPGFHLGLFDQEFGGFSMQAARAIYHCRNVMKNPYPMKMHERERIHNCVFWSRRWERHKYECCMTQVDYYNFIFDQFEELSETLYDALIQNCEPVAADGKKLLHVRSFLSKLAKHGYYPSVHVGESTFSVDGVKAKHQELVELKFYFSDTVPTVSYHYPKRSRYAPEQPVFVTF